MKKRFFSLILAITLIFALALPAFAQANYVVDLAGLLADEEIRDLEEKCAAFYDTCAMELVFLTVDSLEGKSAKDYADDFYDATYGEDGILFLLAMGEREWYISTCGSAIAALSDYDLEHIEYEVLPYLSDGSYYDAFCRFVAVLPQFAEADAPVDVYYDAQGNLHAVYEQEEAGVNLLLSLLIGVVAAGISLLVMRGLMNTKAPKHSAEDYLNRGSYRLTRNQDLFLYSNVSKIRRQEPSNSGRGGSTVHRSSSGRSHGGRGGKF